MYVVGCIASAFTNKFQKLQETNVDILNIEFFFEFFGENNTFLVDYILILNIYHVSVCWENKILFFEQIIKNYLKPIFSL